MAKSEKTCTSAVKTMKFPSKPAKNHIMVSANKREKGGSKAANSMPKKNLV